jgi:fumarylacetoacetase
MAGSWVPVERRSDFPLANLPYGAFVKDGCPRLGVAIGERIFDLHAAADAGLFDGIADRALLRAPRLNDLLAAGRTVWSGLRGRLTELLRKETTAFGDLDRDRFIVDRRTARMAMPFAAGDFVDFYASLEHATNLGKIFRPDGNPLLPNWKWMPIGYHGRSSTIVLDGTPIVRPNGQRKPPGELVPLFGPCTMLDIELEVGFITGSGNAPGTPIAIGRARDYIFGLVLVNDWSARDIQAWEYQPLGPFLGKSFATSISPWVVTLDALEPYRVAGPAQDPVPLPYLHVAQHWNYDITLLVELRTEKMRAQRLDPEIIARSNFRHMYWNMAQQLAHVTSNGTAVRAGDLYASGTISGAAPESYGSLIELTWRGTKPLHLNSGEVRSFLEDGDTITLHGFCEQPQKPRIGFGSVSGTIAASP